MKRGMWLTLALVNLLWATPARADNRIIVRTTLGLQSLQQLCVLQNCTVVSTPVDGTIGRVFLLTTPLDPAILVTTLRTLPGIVDAEVDQLLSLVGGLNNVPTPLPAGLMSDRTLVVYPTNSTTMVWNSYATQPAATIVNVQNAQNSFHVFGTGIVADIDTGVDPSHPALQGVLLPGYDFTRNQAGGSEITDVTATDFPVYPPPQCSSTTCPSAATVNQSTAAVLDQSTAAVLDGNVKYAAFGHGTMVMGVIHLVAPTAQLLPLKAFQSNGTGYLSDILRAIYYAVQNNANVLNMSFDFTTNSQELTNALDYANQLKVVCAASAGNNGQGPPLLVYPAALQNDVMGVASTSDLDTRSSFSNYGNSIVWVAAPGEAIVSTYPFSTYAAGWGTSFSAPFVSGGAALLRSLKTTIDETEGAAAVAHAKALDPALGLNNGRLDLLQALGSLPVGSSSPDYSVSAAPSSQTIVAGEPATFTASAAPQGGFNQTVNWTCTVAPAGPMCSVSPSSVMMDGSNAKTATVTLMTIAHGMSPSAGPWRLPPPVRLRGNFAVSSLLLLAAVMLWKVSRSSRKRLWLTAAFVLLVAGVCASCTGGTGAGSQGTAPGPYTVSVTGTSGNLSHASTVKVTVN